MGFGNVQEQKQKLADEMEKVQFATGERLFSEGEAGDCCYLVRSGTIMTTRGTGSLAKVNAGGCIGERALLADDTR